MGKIANRQSLAILDGRLKSQPFSLFGCIGMFKTNRQSRVSNRSFESQGRQRFESRVFKSLAILDLDRAISPISRKQAPHVFAQKIIPQDFFLHVLVLCRGGTSLSESFQNPVARCLILVHYLNTFGQPNPMGTQGVGFHSVGITSKIKLQV